MLRLEQLTYDEASESCASRGGRLVDVKSAEHVKQLFEFAQGHHLGVGLRDYGAHEYRFDGSATNATPVALALAAKFGDRFMHRDCSRLARAHNGIKAEKGKTAVLEPIDCHHKIDWLCEGTLENKLSASAGIVATGDLKADEGAFCLWHYHEPVDGLPNDEGTNFRNTDLACSLQVSSRSTTLCGYDTEKDRLIRQRGNRSNWQHYPVLGSKIGWSGPDANATLLRGEFADDYFHCHYTPTNGGLLRTFALQHMYERNYAGSMKRTCGCGYKFLAGIVSRCDCTRSGARSNNCARWHRDQLSRQTNKSGEPVRCNNCNSRSNV